ncbi:hypothetical protein H4R35_001363 [Dimargaris xerosporica]|nr:hypothetical protein H4R35_001363 [Dimargaris xerosporica]
MALPPGTTAPDKTAVFPLQRRSPRAPAYFFGHINSGSESESEDEPAFAFTENVPHHRVTLIPVDPTAFYDPSCVQTVANQFAHNCNVHELLSMLLRAYEVVGVPGAYDIVTHFQLFLATYPITTEQGLDHTITAYDEACIVWQYFGLLRGDAEETNDENAVQFLEQTYETLGTLVKLHILPRISELVMDYQGLVSLTASANLSGTVAITEMLHRILEDYGAHPVDGGVELIESIVQRLEKKTFFDLAFVFIDGLYTNRAMIHYHRIERDLQVSEQTPAVAVD